jgi:hypothetical protein
MVRLMFSLVAIVLSLGVSVPVWAGTKEDCVHAAEAGQDLRDLGLLRAARAQFIACAAASCPALVRSDCAKWLMAVEAQTPSVIVMVRDRSGRDLTNVRVFVDGQLMARELDGRAIPLDPGAHTFRLERTGGGGAEQRLLLRAGEKNRRVEAVLSVDGMDSTSPAARGAPGTSVPPVSTTLPRAVLSWLPRALVGVAVGCAGGSVYLGLSAKHDVDVLRARCAPNCSSSQVDAARRKEMAANALGAVSVLSAGTALYLWLAGPSRDASGAAPIAAPLAEGGLVGVIASF